MIIMIIIIMIIIIMSNMFQPGSLPVNEFARDTDRYFCQPMP